MLIRLEPEKVALVWDDIKAMLIHNLPPIAENGDFALNNILEGLLSGYLQAWVLSENGKIYAIAVTMPLIDVASRTKNLLIYSLYGYAYVPSTLWKEGIEGLRIYAKSEGYSKIVGYTKVPRVNDLVKSLGGTADTTLIILEV